MSRSGPIQWRPTMDAEIAKAVERQADVHRRWLAAQTKAREAVEAIALARAEDEGKRADAVAAGKPDPGAKPLDRLEAAADDAAGRRDVAGEAFRRSRAATLALADERQDAWTAAASEAVTDASEAVATAIDALAVALDTWTEARAEFRLASDPSLRERGRVSTPIPALDALRQSSGEGFPVPTVVAALRQLVEAPEAVTSEVEVEVALSRNT